MNEKKEFWHLLIKLAIPIALQNLLINSLTFVDTFFMSQLGDIALSASGMASQWNWLLTVCTFGICSGSALFVAQYWGAREKKGIYKTYQIALLSAVVVSLLFFSCAFFGAEGLVRFFNKDSQVISAGSAYLTMVCFSYPATVISSVLCTVLRSTERVKLPMAVSFLSTVINVILDYALVFGKLGLPEMGIRGAALATAISAWIGPAVILLVSAKQKNILMIPSKYIFRFHKEDIVLFFKRAFPIIINEFLWGAGMVCNNAIYSNTGYENYAACTILRTVESLGLILFIGLNDGGAVIVGKRVGEKRNEDAYRAAKRLVITAPILSLLLGLVIIGFRNNIIHVFNMSGNITNTTLSIASVIIIIYALELILRNIPYTLICAVFRSAGDSLTGAKFDVLCLWLLAIPATFIAAHFLKLPFVFVFLTEYLVEDIPKSILCIRHFIKRKWIKPVTN